MRQTNKLILIFGLFLAVAFVLGLGRLFVLRFEAGDVYPAYSSLRADPLGTKAFYESLRDTGRFAVTRSYVSPARIDIERGFTLFCLGTAANASFLRSPAHLDSFNGKVLNGARLVLSLSVVKTAGRRAPDRQPPKKRSRPSAENDADPAAPVASEAETTGVLQKKWQVRIAGDRLQTAVERADLAPAFNGSGLPAAIAWHSPYYFTDLSAAWRVTYRAGDRPVVIERPLGQGMLVLLADSFPLSNEALRDERYPRLLTWLAGPNRQVVFDETHLGLHQRPGVAALVRRSRLHWPLAAIFVLALLFVWKNAVPFVPPPADLRWRIGHAASAKDYTQGLISLLRRSIAAAQILETMVAQWQRDLPRNRPLSAARRRRIQAVLEKGTPTDPQQIDPVSAYHTIHQLITEKSDEK